MLEKQNIQSRGFHNIYDADGNAIGFEVCVRSTYYKGIWLSQLRVGDVVIDGEVFGRDNQLWIINDVEYTADEMEKISQIHWHILDVATIRIMKEGGLSQGYHDVEVNFGTVSSYGPAKFAPRPETDEDMLKPFPIEVFSMLATNKYTRKLLIV